MNRCVVMVVVALAGGSAYGQSINVSFGHSSGGPSSSYAAAGASGEWNAVTGVAGSTWKLVDIKGDATSVSISQSPTTSVITTTDSSITGDDGKLLNSGLVTTGAETCLFFNGFKPGSYEVLVYAWIPKQPTMKSQTRQDQAPSTIDVGGTWKGTQTEGVTYARYVVTVGSDGSLPAHSGLAPSTPQAALNGVQIRPLETATHDASEKPIVDASEKRVDDASVAPAVDAGTTVITDAAVTSTPPPTDNNVDAAEPHPTPVQQHGGGCSVTNHGAASPLAIFMLAALLVAAQRRKRTDSALLSRSQ